MHSSELALGEAGHKLVGVPQQLVHATGGDPGVEPHLLDRGAEHDLAVRAGDEVDGGTADDGPDRPAEQGIGGGCAQAQDLALHRAHGGDDVVWEPAELGGPATGGEHDRGGAAPVDADRTAAFDVQVRAMFGDELDAGGCAGGQQGGNEAPVVHLMVVVDQQAAAYRRAEHRL